MVADAERFPKEPADPPGALPLARALDATLLLIDGRGRPRAVRVAASHAERLGLRPGPVRLLRAWRSLFRDRRQARQALVALARLIAGTGSTYRTRLAAGTGAPLELVMGRCQTGSEDLTWSVQDVVALSLAPLPEETLSELRRYRELFDASPDLYLTLDRRGRIEEVNRRTERVLGFPTAELIGRHPFRWLPRESRRRVRAALPSLLSSGSLENLELRLVRRDGQPLDVIANAVAVRDPRGGWSGVRTVLRDVTQRTLLQRQLRQTDRLAATGRLAAGIAHEINNPLQAVLTHLAVVQSALPRPFEGQDSWERVEEGLGRIRQIVEDLLDLHRGRGLERGPVDVRRVIDEALGLVRSQVRQRRIEVAQAHAADLPPVAATMRHVYQIVLNLILNALDAMAEGGVLTLQTRHATATAEVEIDIADTGVGISEQMLPRLFDPFRSASSESGTGLGLFVTYGLVREYGGRIRVDSMPGRGTTFTVSLPRWGSPT
jgi:PAS domain S-box-containing protein